LAIIIAAKRSDQERILCRLCVFSRNNNELANPLDRWPTGRPAVWPSAGGWSLFCWLVIRRRQAAASSQLAAVARLPPTAEGIKF
jgi:hypothetical protein